MSNTLRRLAVSLSVAVLAFGATACGSDDAPAAPAPGTAAVATDAPATDAPATDAPATDAPATDAPATDAPATDAPATGAAPSGDRAADEALVTGWVAAQLSAAGLEGVDPTCVGAVVAQLSEEDMVLMAEAAANNEPSVPTLSEAGDALGTQVGACGTFPTEMLTDIVTTS